MPSPIKTDPLIEFLYVSDINKPNSKIIHSIKVLVFWSFPASLIHQPACDTTNCECQHSRILWTRNRQHTLKFHLSAKIRSFRKLWALTSFKAALTGAESHLNRFDERGHKWVAEIIKVWLETYHRFRQLQKPRAHKHFKISTRTLVPRRWLTTDSSKSHIVDFLGRWNFSLIFWSITWWLLWEDSGKLQLKRLWNKKIDCLGKRELKWHKILGTRLRNSCGYEAPTTINRPAILL